MQLLCWGQVVFSWTRIKIDPNSHKCGTELEQPTSAPSTLSAFSLALCTWRPCFLPYLNQGLLSSRQSCVGLANGTHWQNSTVGRNRVRVFRLVAPSWPGCRLSGASCYKPGLGSPLQSCKSQLSSHPFGPCSNDFSSYLVQNFNTPILSPNP